MTITAQQTLPNGTVDAWEVQTLQPWSWLRRHQANVGGVLGLDSLLDSAEMGVPQGVVGTISAVAAALHVERGRAGASGSFNASNEAAAPTD